MQDQAQQSPLLAGRLLQEQVSGLARQRHEVESLRCGREGCRPGLAEFLRGSLLPFADLTGPSEVLRGLLRSGLRRDQPQALETPAVPTRTGVVHGDGQEVGATPVPGGLSRPERRSAGFGAPGVAPTFCPCRSPGRIPGRGRSATGVRSPFRTRRAWSCAWQELKTLRASRPRARTGTQYRQDGWSCQKPWPWFARKSRARSVIMRYT